MQIKLFTIPISDSGQALEEMNRFLRGNKVLETVQHFYQNDRSAIWCFCIKYLETNSVNAFVKKDKVDYKQLLAPIEFDKFSLLRECRKEIAKLEGVPAYAVFTDEELSCIAKLSEITVSGLIKVKGIGQKKSDRFGERMIALYNQKGEHETSGEPDTPDSRS
ncbi:MAG: HRDC domain-containing protein [Bacteroidetes bacterium]|nr:HRDC domain-containing protein [Bacteroidota bacterium]MBL6964780.1 HRDC domain-containing protein [Bacteroidota bacterium]